MSRFVWKSFELKGRGRSLVQGRAVGRGVGVGRVRVLRGTADFDRFQPGEVLVAERTESGWEEVIKRAAAVVTDRGGPTSHTVIAGRALRRPTIVGSLDGTRVLADGAPVTVWCGSAAGSVFAGDVAFEEKEHELDLTRRPTTKVMVNVGTTAEAHEAAGLPCDGAGLVRTEFLIRNVVGIHPMALCAFEKVTDGATRSAIEQMTDGVADKTDFFEAKLGSGIEEVARAFYPREVVIRLSDLKSNEYADLVGGEEFEAKEENPMLGVRGASRYLADSYRAAFAAECRAIARVRRERGLENIRVIVPFCRTTGEAESVLKEMAGHGLERGVADLGVDMMCEVPSNVVLIDEFADLFDGFSIGSNDLTQLVLGVDRDAEELWRQFDERDLAVCRMISTAIAGAKRKNRRVGLCGQAPSDYPEFLRFLIDEGIESVSLNADSIIEATAQILEIEDARARG
ncbi:MAG TPA: putative PEP-binding protein [Thermoanaerobaculia bacterium]|nr:putative PEP-binding protein [Thermoanaerobaculia bacterium]